MKNIAPFLIPLFISSILTAQSPGLEWARAFGGKSADGSLDISRDPSGNLFLGGYFIDTADFDPGPANFPLVSKGSSDIFVQKLDDQGQFLWARTMGGPGIDQAMALEVDAGGNIYLSGIFRDSVDFDPGSAAQWYTAVGNFDVFILKLDPAGNLLWVKTLGGVVGDHATALAINPAGDLLIAGNYGGTVDFDPGPGVQLMTASDDRDLYLLQLDAQGGFKKVQSMGAKGWEQINEIICDPAGQIYLAGGFEDTTDLDPGSGIVNFISAGGDDLFVLKLDANGKYLWARTFGGINSDRAYGLTYDAAGNIYVGGLFMDSVDFDPGQADSILVSAGSADIYLLKLDNQGDFVWVRSMGGSGWDAMQCLGIDRDDHLYLGGIFEDSADFDPASPIHYAYSAGDFDAFLQSLDSQGNFRWVATAGSIGSDGVNCLYCDSAGTLFSTGEFADTVDFDPDTTVSQLFSQGLSDVFLQKIRQDYISLPSMLKLSSLQLYPNPAHSQFKLELPQAGRLRLSIYAFSGELVWSVEGISSQLATIKLSLPAGLYLLIAEAGAELYYQNLLIH